MTMNFINIFKMLNFSFKCKVRRRFNGFSLYPNSYFIHRLAVILLLLAFYIDTSFSAEVLGPRSSSQPSPSLLKILHPHPHNSPPPEKLSKSSRNFSPRKDDTSTSLFFDEDENGVPIVVGTWFRYGSYTLAFALFGTVFLSACAATAVYYTLFVVTEPSQQLRSSSLSSSSLNGVVDGWNVARVLRALHLAYETYETFDPYNASCQLKTVCEIQEGPHFQGSLLKRLVHFLIHSELVQRKLENAEELQAADRVGNDPREACKEKYSECRFSLNRLYERYVKL